MGMMPDLDLDFYTPKELAIRWSRKMSANITIEDVIGYGKSGLLKFVAANPKGEEIQFMNMWEEDQHIQGTITHLPLTVTEFNRILNSDMPVRLDSYSETVSGARVEFLIDPMMCCDYGKESLNISRQGVLQFEKALLNDEKEVLPEYLDHNHLCYPREIAIAIGAHRAIFLEKEGNQSQSPTERVRTWLKANYAGESGAFYKRIITVVLPKDNKTKK